MHEGKAIWIYAHCLSHLQSHCPPKLAWGEVLVVNAWPHLWNAPKFLSSVAATAKKKKKKKKEKEKAICPHWWWNSICFGHQVLIHIGLSGSVVKCFDFGLSHCVVVCMIRSNTPYNHYKRFPNYRTATKKCTKIGISPLLLFFYTTVAFPFKRD